MTPQNTLTYYEILDLKAADLTPTTLKSAYRLALLRHHPDKASPKSIPSQNLPDGGTTWTVDRIRLAYTTLSTPRLRAEYDKTLLAEQGRDGKPRGFHTGEEAIDLDDMDYDPVANSWHRSCRCGEEKGYMVTEAELEEAEIAAGRGEVVVGCVGCSLVVRVGFGVVDEEDGSTDEHIPNGQGESR